MKVVQMPKTTFVYCLHCGTCRHNNLSECPTLQRIAADIRRDAAAERPVAGRSALWVAIVAIGIAVAAFNYLLSAK